MNGSVDPLGFLEQVGGHSDMSETGWGPSVRSGRVGGSAERS